MDAPGLPGNDRQEFELFEAIARSTRTSCWRKDLPKCTRSSASLRRCFPGAWPHDSTLWRNTPKSRDPFLGQDRPGRPLIWPANRAVSGDEVPGFAVKRAQSLRLNELYLAKRIDYFDGGVDVCIVLTLDGRSSARPTS